MREALLKRRYGIPVVLFLVLLFSGTALAWYSVKTVSSKTPVIESLSTANNKKFSETMLSGETIDLLEEDQSANINIPIPPIPENGTMSCIVVITVENDATPGYNTVRLEPSQE